jgi:hypothetical protein
MRVLKIFALALLSLVLLVSLSAFGIVSTVSRTALNPRFVTMQINRLDTSALIKEAISLNTTTSLHPLVISSLEVAIPKLEPEIKTRLATATNTVYDYVRGKTDSIDLKATLSNTFVNKEFIGIVINDGGVSSILANHLLDDFARQIPLDMAYLLKYVNLVMPQAESLIKEELTNAATPIVDYLLGDSQDLDITISYQTIAQKLKAPVKTAFLLDPPAELAGLSQGTLEQDFEQGYSQLTGQMTEAIRIDRNSLGVTPAEIDSGLAEAEAALQQARQDVNSFQMGFVFLIFFIMLLILGVALVSHAVRAATLTLGVTFIIAGIIDLVSVGIIRGMLLANVTVPGLPALQTWLTQVFNDTLQPLRWLGIGFIVGGAALLVVAQLYRPARTYLLGER